MNVLKQEKGYTLIIVLLLIVLFLGMSAVFMQASLSHSKQEQTVDYSNQAVAAAEMGVENYSLETEKAFDETYKLVSAEATAKKQGLENEIKKYPNLKVLNGSCPVNKEKLQEWIDCNISAYTIDLKASFQTKMKNRLSAINRNKVVVDEGLTYSLTNVKLKPSTVLGSSIMVELEIVGEKSTAASSVSTTSKSKELSTELTFPEVPFYDEEKMADVEVIWQEEIKEVTNFFPQLLNKPLLICPQNQSDIKANMAPCKYDGESLENYLEKFNGKNMSKSFYLKISEFPKNFNNINGHNIPILLDDGTVISSPNLNKTVNLHLYYKGQLKLHEANNTNNLFLVAETIMFHKKQEINNSTLIILGNIKQKQEFIADQLIINQKSKLCINGEGISNDINDPLFKEMDIFGNGEKPNKNKDLAVAEDAQVIFYTKKNPTPQNTANVKYFNKPEEFLTACGVSAGYKIDGKGTFNIPVITTDLEWNVDMEVDY
ncbi:Tfp pilus assembly protein PilX [Planomicrobium sp. HSC-17F08]|nr:Tfp pilus assembly protein PilX [Planomicrobium sp. HSC-17F08]